MSAFFKSFPRNILKCFTGHNLLWHLLAIVLTYIIATSGFDWLYFTSSRSTLLQTILFPAVRLGSRVPVFAPLVLYAAGKVRENTRTMSAALALAQAALIGLFLAAFYKAFTGRVHPPRFLIQSTLDISRDFRFGFMRGGVFWGWPSSHTTVAFAMATAMVTMYPRKLIVRYGAIVYALYVGFGVSISIHWFSDFVAGAVFGTIIGAVVGHSFRSDIVEGGYDQTDGRGTR